MSTGERDIRDRETRFLRMTRIRDLEKRDLRYGRCALIGIWRVADAAEPELLVCESRQTMSELST